MSWLIAITVAEFLLLVGVVIFLVVRGRDASNMTARVAEMRTLVEKFEPSLRSEVREFRTELMEQGQRSRKEATEEGRSLREELLNTVRVFGEQINEAVAKSRQEQGQAGDQLRESVQRTLVSLGGELREGTNELSRNVQERLTEFAGKVSELTASNEQRLEAIRQSVASQLGDLKEQHVRSSEQLGESIQSSFSRLSADLRETSRQLNEAVQQRLTDMGHKVAELVGANERGQESLRKSVEEKLTQLNENNARKLEEVRVTVDEKLHSTLEKRLTDSFGLVTEQLGSVQRGLGEMKDLANGVGDLKRVLTNIRSRGGYGEVQLQMLLEQMLSPEQYVKNVNVRPNTQEAVEFAIKFPGPASGEPVLLPIDAKFPREAWEQLEDAQVRGDQDGVKQAAEKLEAVIRSAAKDISAKYIEPPLTTNFAVMFLPTEGLFAEVVRRPGLVDELQTKYHITIAGPTTFAALLTSFQMGFRTLAIQKKGSEVWKVLAATKLEFEKFGGLMDRVDKNIGTVQNTLREVGTRSRAITRKLRDVETADVPLEDPGILGLTESREDDEALFEASEAAQSK
jgi:DNA recombination protein RmuC